MAAEGPLHELGAIGIVNSDSQGMGRMMETVRRTFQLAHVMSTWRKRTGWSSGDPFDDQRARPALPRQGHDRAGDHPRDRRSRRLAPARPPRRHRPVEAGLLRGQAGARAQGRRSPPGLRSARATPRSNGAEPTRYQAGWGGLGRSATSLSRTFVSAAADPRALAVHGRAVTAISGSRGLTRASLLRNQAVAAIEVDVIDGAVSLDGRSLAVAPVREVPLSRRYFLR